MIKYGYEQFVNDRYSEETIKDASSIFGWGLEDTETLKKIHNKYSTKIHKTGSPRVDLWRSTFLEYWGKPKGMPQKPFLLVVSNMSYANYIIPFKNIIKTHRVNELYKFKPNMFKESFGKVSEQYVQ